jgi:hypothetical protein
MAYGMAYMVVAVSRVALCKPYNKPRLDSISMLHAAPSMLVLNF